MREEWSAEEEALLVADYLEMLQAELERRPYSKAEHRRGLQPHLPKRAEKAIEFKYGNVSAALRDLGFPFVDGYKPYSNYKAALSGVVAEQLHARPGLLSLIESDVTKAATVPSLDDILSVLVDAPTPVDEPRPRALPQAWFERPALPGVVNYLAREAANASLGAAGEEFAERFETARLVAAGREQLASRVERVSRTRGDGLGFDLLSFETDGRERLIEVKTTRYGKHTPFFLTRNEVRTSDTYATQYVLYRLFDFREVPRMFALPGSVRASCRMDPAVYEAVVG